MAEPDSGQLAGLGGDDPGDLSRFKNENIKSVSKHFSKFLSKFILK